jgi:hypothetical protein
LLIKAELSDSNQQPQRSTDTNLVYKVPQKTVLLALLCTATLWNFSHLFIQVAAGVSAPPLR